MMTATDLARSLAPVVGKEYVIPHPELNINGLQPKLLVEPGSAEEIAACLKVCGEAGAAVVPAGLMTWLDGGNPLARADVVLGLERMNRVVEYSPSDLTATVEAGLSLGDFNTLAGREGQWLPLDPPGAPRASLGAIAACASSGPLRLGFGTPRDYVIGLRLAHADGTESRCGGRVVKNVAGYDLNKLYVGSFGTLAVITEVTFKLRPLPERVATLRRRDGQPAPLFEAAGRLLAAHLQPASVYLTRDGAGNCALLARFAEGEAAVTYQLGEAARLLGAGRRPELLAENEAARVWAEVANLDKLKKTALRASVLPADARTVFDRLSALLPPNSPMVMDVGVGSVRAAFDLDGTGAAELIKAARATLPGTLFVERASAEVKRWADAWGEVGPTAGLMRAIKAKFDPHALLNPGRFVSGI